MNILVKVLTAGAGLGVLGGAGLATNYFLSDNSLASELKKKGHTLLNYDTNKNDDSSVWNPIVKAYASSTTKFKGVEITIASGTSGTPSKENIDALKIACKNAITSSKYDENTSKVTEQFCVTPITIKNLVEKQRTVLNSKDNEDKDQTEWNSLVTNYSSASSDKQIANVSLSQAGEKEKRDALKKGCEGLKDTKTHDTNYHKQYEQFVNWCSVPKKIMA